MKIVVDVPDYDPNKGIQLKHNAESKLTVIIGYDDFEIGGNPRGLRTLGSCFLSLAQKNVPNGASIRLTEKNGLMKGSIDLKIRKEEDPSEVLNVSE